MNRGILPCCHSGNALLRLPCESSRSRLMRGVFPRSGVHLHGLVKVKVNIKKKAVFYQRFHVLTKSAVSELLMRY